MDDRQKIQDRLRKKEQEIQSLEERLRSARTYMSALQDILKLLGDEQDAPTTSGATLRSGSSVDQARQAILSRGAPVHISTLAEMIGQDTKEGRISLASSIAAYVRRGEIFTRSAPNTFGLIELGHRAAAPADSGPPAGFGQISSVTQSKSAEVNAHKVEREEPPGQEDDIPF